MTRAAHDRLHVSILERDETALDAVTLMAGRLGARVSIYVDDRLARTGIRMAKPSVLLLEPRHLHCELADFVASLQSECDPIQIVLMTTLTADELRAMYLPICWDALLHKPFTYSRFEAVMRVLLGEPGKPASMRNREH